MNESTFQSSNPVVQYIVHNYMHVCAVALITPSITSDKILINHNATNQFKSLKCHFSAFMYYILNVNQ